MEERVLMHISHWLLLLLLLWVLLVHALALALTLILVLAALVLGLATLSLEHFEKRSIVCHSRKTFTHARLWMNEEKWWGMERRKEVGAKDEKKGKGSWSL